jgi:hypothetical protein
MIYMAVDIARSSLRDKDKMAPFGDYYILYYNMIYCHISFCRASPSHADQAAQGL